MGITAQARELRRIAAENIRNNQVLMTDLADRAVTKYEGTKGGVAQSFLDGFSVGFAAALGMVIEGKIDIEAVRRQARL